MFPWENCFDGLFESVFSEPGQVYMRVSVCLYTATCMYKYTDQLTDDRDLTAVMCVYLLEMLL